MDVQAELEKILEKTGASTELVKEEVMPNKTPKTKTEEPDIQPPTTPVNPVELSRWVQQTHNNPKAPKVQPDDSAMRLKPMDKPDVNRSIGTDKPRRSKLKNPNVTRSPYSTYANRRALKRLLWPKLGA